MGDPFFSGDYEGWDTAYITEESPCFDWDGVSVYFRYHKDK